jgi:hypothetical protein
MCGRTGCDCSEILNSLMLKEEWQNLLFLLSLLVQPCCEYSAVCDSFVSETAISKSAVDLVIYFMKEARNSI